MICIILRFHYYFVYYYKMINDIFFVIWILVDCLKTATTDWLRRCWCLLTDWRKLPIGKLVETSVAKMGSATTSNGRFGWLCWSPFSSSVYYGGPAVLPDGGHLEEEQVLGVWSEVLRSILWGRESSFLRTWLLRFTLRPPPPFLQQWKWRKTIRLEELTGGVLCTESAWSSGSTPLLRAINMAGPTSLHSGKNLPEPTYLNK